MKPLSIIEPITRPVHDRTFTKSGLSAREQRVGMRPTRPEPSAAQDRLPRPPGVGVLGMRNPGADLRLDLAAIDRAGAPAVAQAAHVRQG
jgi:hypothetical protein